MLICSMRRKGFGTDKKKANVQYVCVYVYIIYLYSNYISQKSVLPPLRLCRSPLGDPEPIEDSRILSCYVKGESFLLVAGVNFPS